MRCHDMPGEYFRISFPSERLCLTHEPSGNSVLRTDDMFGPKGTAKWHARLSELARFHPVAHRIYDFHDMLVADVRDFPALGGGFSVGDVVVTWTHEGARVARDIVHSSQNRSHDGIHPGVMPEYLGLEDGSTLYYSNLEGGWKVTDPHGHCENARRALPEDDVEALREPPVVVFRRFARLLASGLNQNDELRSAIPSLAQEGALQPSLEDDFISYRKGLHDSLAALFHDPGDEAAHVAGIGFVTGLKALIAEVREAHAKHRPDQVLKRSLLSGELRFLDVFCEGLRRRGLLPESPEPGTMAFRLASESPMPLLPSAVEDFRLHLADLRPDAPFKAEAPFHPGGAWWLDVATLPVVFDEGQGFGMFGPEDEVPSRWHGDAQAAAQEAARTIRM